MNYMITVQKIQINQLDLPQKNRTNFIKNKIFKSFKFKTIWERRITRLF